MDTKVCTAAVGALAREAEHAESKADFIHKLSIAQKEFKEMRFFINNLQLTINKLPEEICAE